MKLHNVKCMRIALFSIMEIQPIIKMIHCVDQELDNLHTTYTPYSRTVSCILFRIFVSWWEATCLVHVRTCQICHCISSKRSGRLKVSRVAGVKPWGPQRALKAAPPGYLWARGDGPGDGKCLQEAFGGRKCKA